MYYSDCTDSGGNTTQNRWSAVDLRVIYSSCVKNIEDRPEFEGFGSRAGY